MKHRLSLLAFAFCALSTARLPATEWVLSFAVTEDRVIESPDGKAPPRHETRNYSQAVALGTDYLVVQDDQQTTVYDFTRRRLVVITPATATQTDLSLYHLPSFLGYELMNRNAIGAAMRAAKVDRLSATFTRFDNETALRVESRRAPPDSPVPVIETVQQAGTLEFRHQDAVAVRFTPADPPLPPGWQHRFVNYLAYACNIHPQVRRAIAGTGTVPRELVFTWRTAGNVTTTTLRLLSSAAAETDSSLPPAGLKPAEHPGDPFYAILPAIENAAREQTRPGRAAVIQFADEALAAQRPLDAMLALLEFTLQSGEPMNDEIRARREAFNRDPACQAYRGAFGQSDKATAEKNLAASAAIAREGLAKAHMLDLQRANLLEGAGRPREAIALLLQVLRANPQHAGALHDLGMIYARGFEPGKAWLCWDLARRLYPRHPMLEDVNRIERDLVQNQPDFF